MYVTSSWSPFFSTAVLASGAILNAGTEAEKQALLPGIAAGDTIATLAWVADAPHALLGADTLRWALWLLPAMLVGIAIGQRGFAGVSPAAFRRRVLELLVVVSALTMLRAAWALAA